MQPMQPMAVMTIEPVAVGPTQAQRGARRIATMLVVGGAIYLALGFISLATGGRGSNNAGTFVIGALYFGSGAVGLDATKQQRVDKAKRFRLLMWIVVIVSIITSIVQLVFAIIYFKDYSSAEEDAAKAAGDDYGSKTSRVVALAISAIGLVITVVVCPMLGKQVEAYKVGVEAAEAEIASLPMAPPVYPPHNHQQQHHHPHNQQQQHHPHNQPSQQVHSQPGAAGSSSSYNGSAQPHQHQGDPPPKYR
jgi:hypothetical protein